MRIECTGCGQAMNVPDDRLPAVPKFMVRCPKCQQEITVERPEFAAQAVQEHEHGQAESAAPAAATPPPPPPPPPGPDIPAGLEPEIFPPGAKVAFVSLADTAWREGAEAFLKEQGYALSEAESPGEAVGKLRLNHYDLLLLDQGETGRTILTEIATWSGLKRREANIVLVGQGAPSLDPKASFENGVNNWLALDDAGRAADLLGQALEAYTLYYQPLTQAQTQAGARAK